MVFDARAAKAMPSGEHIVIEGAPGLRLVATATRKTWTYRYRSQVDDRVRQIRLGHWPAMGLPAAFAAWQRLKAERDAGGDPAGEKRARRAATSARSRVEAYTVRAVCDEYLVDLERRAAPRTFAEARRMLERELGAIEARPAASITRADAFDLLDAMLDRPALAAALRQHLGAAWDRALDAGRLGPDVPNWWRQVMRGKLRSRGKIVGGQHQGAVKRALSEAELALLIPWLPNFSRVIEDVLTLYLWTCCRGAEIVAMERGELTHEQDGMWWTVPRAKLKMRRNALTTDLRVPLVGRAEAVVRRRCAATAQRFLFPSHGASGHLDQKAASVAVWTHMPGCQLRPQWERPRLPVTAWAPHDLRRTGRTMLAALGCPRDVAEVILGHRLPGVEGVYNVHQYDAERRAWLSRLADRLEMLGATRAQS